MSIYDNGYQFAWEIWVGLLLAGVVLWLGIRSSRRADRRHQAQAAPRQTKPPTAKRPLTPKD